MKRKKVIRMTKWLTFLGFLLISLHSRGQHVVEFNGNVQEGDILAARVEDKLYVRDTLNSSNSELSNGLYTLVRDTLSLFDFVVFNENVVIDFSGDLPTYRDSLNAQFYRFIHNHLEQGQDLGEDWKSRYPEAVELLRVVFPQIFTFDGKTHKQVATQYWDLTDGHYQFLKNSPFVRQYLNNFYDRMISQHYDSIFTCVETQMRFVRDSDVRPFYFSVLTNKFETSKIVGHENVFASMVKGFPKSDFGWVEDTVYLKLQEKADKIRLNPVGGRAKSFPIKNFKSGSLSSLNQIFGIYKLVVFFDSDCGHCKEAMPFYMEVINEFKNNGLTPVLITVETTNEFLREFISSRDYNPSYFYYHHDVTQDDFRLKYDIPSTPQVYILDSSNTILAKNIPAKELKDYFTYLVNQ